jgi:hypothetical protein
MVSSLVPGWATLSPIATSMTTCQTKEVSNIAFNFLISSVEPIVPLFAYNGSCN